MSSTDSLYAELVRAFDARHLAEACDLAGRLIEQTPDHAKAWHLLGLARLMGGEVAAARDALDMAARLNPQDAEVFDHLGVAANQLGDAAAAEAAHVKSLAIDPRRAESWLNAAKSHRDAARIGKAVAAYQQALILRPGWPQALCGLAEVFRQEGESEAALGCYEQVLAADRGNVEALIGRADTLVAIDREGEALQTLDQALKEQPGVAALWAALGALLFDVDRRDDAVACYERAIGIEPQNVATLVNFSAVLLGMGQGSRAIPQLEAATAIDARQPQAWANLGAAYVSCNRRPEGLVAYRRALAEGGEGIAAIHNNLGDLLRDLGELADAEAHFRKAVELFAAYAEARVGLGTVLLEQGKAEAAVEAFRGALVVDPASQSAASNLLYAHNFLVELDRPAYRQALRQFGEIVRAKARPFTEWPAAAERGRALRVGFVSGDLVSHPVGYFLRHVMPGLQAAGLETVAYYNHTVEDQVTAAIAGSVSAFHRVSGLSDAALAQQIHADRIDILVDLSGHTARHRLAVFAWKPAPVQVSWMYFASTGVAEIDYFIADRDVLPESQRTDFVEQPFYLPDTYYCFSAPEFDLAPAPLPMLVNGYPTFGCCNRISKLNDEVIALWAKLLLRVPTARLLLKATQFNDAATVAAMRGRFAEQGVGAERLILEGPSSREDYLAGYSRIDVALDPFPFAGGTTTIEGLWMGVPVVTLAGDRMAGRQGVSILNTLGMRDWIADDRARYLDLAARVVSDPVALAQTRAGLRARLANSALFDAPAFARKLADALRVIWESPRPAGRSD